MNNQDIGLESGRKFGLSDSEDFEKLYKKFNSQFLGLLVEKIGKNGVVIGDYGGGNGILHLELKKLLKNKDIKRFVIQNIDIDSSKFEKRDFVENICEDVLKFKSKKKQDFAICRHVLHYFNEKEELKLLKNINFNLKDSGYLLLINFFVEGENRIIKEKILEKIIELKGIGKRTFLSDEKVKELCLKAGFEIVEELRFDYRIYLENFFKQRFKLSDDEIEKIRKYVGVEGHEEMQLGFLLKKVCNER